MEKTNWIIAAFVAFLVGLGIGHFTAGPTGGPASIGSVGSKAPTFARAGAGDVGKTPADLPPSYIKEAEFPAGTFANLTDAQKYTVLKVANEKNCNCGCANDTVAKCRTHDPSCATAPQLLNEIIAQAKQGKSAQEITVGGANKPAGPSDDSSVVFKVPVGDSPVRGNAEAKVTIVEFSDFQCPFCSRAEVTVDEVRKLYGPDVRVVYKQNPLPFHPHATPAAKASLAAGAQGKFWEMHDLLFKNQQHLEQSDFETYARDLNLDVERFKADLASNKFDAAIERDKAQAAKLGATGTPAFFINGKKLVGAQPLDKFKAVIDEQKAVAEKKLASGTSASGLYDALIASGMDAPPAAAPAQAPAQASAKKVDIAAFNPVRGPKAAPVTMVMWSDFQCPFCSRVEPTVKQVEETYGSKVKVVWRNEPLPFHPNAMPAAKAAMAAAEQGKFWEMHDLLFANQQKLSAADLEGYAKQLGLNVEKWKTDMESEKVKNEIAEDQKVGSAVGANGTPTFFVNGKEISGAVPFDNFKTVIDEQLKKADELQKKGVKLDDLYAKLIEANMGSDKGGPAQTAPAPAADAPVVVNIADAPTRGPKNAPITLVEFSDFQCPFCSRGYATVNEVEKQYEGKVKVVFKQNPLPFHNNAMPAAQASLAAAEQGKFWQMYDVLFKNQTQLSRENLDSYAQQIGLNMDKFKAAMDSGKFKAKVDADLEDGRKAGVSGTPTFVINGHKLVGAQPIEAFKSIIDAELAKGPAGRKVAGK